MVDERSPEVWDAAADDFDEAADHGLSNLLVRAAWTRLLDDVLPESPVRVADLGCGTGTLAVLLAQRGDSVTGLDFSARMIELARLKAADSGVEVDWIVGDAANPALEPGTFDVVLCRHVLWALPDPSAVLGRWVRLLSPGGRLVLIEGRWSTGAGLPSSDLVDLAAGAGLTPVVRQLDDPALWGAPIADERYLIVATPAEEARSSSIVSEPPLRPTTSNPSRA